MSKKEEALEEEGTVNQELNTTILIVTHDPDIAYKVGRVVMILDGKMSTEIRRKVSFKRLTGEAEAGAELEEFTLVDRAGRVQIPREYLDELKIKGRARVVVEEGKITLRSGDA